MESQNGSIMDRRLKYPIGVQSFESLRKDGYIYIDKTQYLRELLRNRYYFLSRPRRFGKSLLLSMLEAYFKGRKELFEGLAVSGWEKDWTEYPVIRVDFSAMTGHDTETLVRELRRSLERTGRLYGLEAGRAGWTPEEFSLGELFGELVDRLAEKFGRRVVILIDEYDKGLIETLEDEERLSGATDALRPFFSMLKSRDENIRFAFITGVSRFRNTTIFSGANNLYDKRPV